MSCTRLLTAAHRFTGARDTEPLIRLADLAVERKDYLKAAEWLEQAYWLDNRPETHQAIVQLRRLADLEDHSSRNAETKPE